MKTNKILAIGLLAAATVLTTGCSDSFLEVENPTGEPLEDYYTTDEHIQEALIAAYDPLHWPDWGLGQYNALNIDGEIMGDNFWVGGATRPICRIGICCLIMRLMKIIHLALFGQWTILVSNVVMTY